MGQLIAEMELRHPELPYFDAGRTGDYPAVPPVDIDDLQEMYPEAANRVKEDPDFAARARQATVELQAGRPGYRALWEHFRSVSAGALQSVYDALDVHFDLWLGEASVHDRIAPLVERLKESGVAIESDGALVIPVAEPGDTKEIPPFMLVNSRGGYTYATTDLATIEERIDDLGAQELIYLVDLRQSLHFEQLFRAARRAGLADDSIIMEHPGNGTVNGPDGRPFKTRAGGTPRLRDTIADAIDRAKTRLDESDIAVDYPLEERTEIARRVGLAALKYGELSNHRTSDYSFDLDRFTQLQGRTGPYIQYVAARASSLLSKAAAADLELGRAVPPSQPAERYLILEMTRFPEVLDRAITTRAPNHLAEYAYDLAVKFNRFYDACHVLTEQDTGRRASWLTLVAQLRRLLSTVLDLLGIEIPDRM
jgi:arginyl-tRNA synthetase